MMMNVLLAYAFYYPLAFSILWIFGGVYFFFRIELRSRGHNHPPHLDHWPRATLVIPCHNEGENVRETLAFAAGQDYPDLEIIAIDDGSSDDTGLILDELTGEYPALRVLHFPRNQGKAMGLRMAALTATSDYLVCIDGDALLDRHATRWLVWHLVIAPHVGAVTGNPRVRNRSTLLGRLQVGEFSSIIGLIKRAQRIYGSIFTVSGVIAAFRVSALHSVGYWNTDMVTEDIDISWRLQMDSWDIRYEPNALCWILMPETLRGLWKQRLRWAQGGAETMRRYMGRICTWRQRRMWFIAAECALNTVWSYVMLAVVAMTLLGTIVHWPSALRITGPIAGWNGAMLGALCIFQFAVSLAIDSRYEKNAARQMLWTIWYPFAFWLVGMLTTVVAVPRVLTRKANPRAIWESPDRGIR
jgi:biofilm PGA synthesis N-glycosyltransferase PgaC